MEKFKYTVLALLCALAVLLILKLSCAVAWSWWWVLAPLWMPMALAFLCAMVLFLCVLFVKDDDAGRSVFGK